MTETPFPWARRPSETPKSYAAFLAYIALGACRSVREAAGQHHVKTGSSSRKKTTINTWLGWSARHKWVSRANARDEWIARTSDEQTAANVRKCGLALTEKALLLLETGRLTRLSSGGASAGPPLPAGAALGGCDDADRGCTGLAG